ncbi:MAG: aquaporin [Tepidisphaera sp.]
MNKLIAEWLGTFCLVFAGTGAIIVNEVTGGSVTHVGVALTFGLVVMVMIHALGAVSGAHLNPAVSVGLAMAGRFRWRSIPGYVLAQVAGALAASWLLSVLFPASVTLGATLPAGSDWQAFVLEVVLAFMLMLVILSVTSIGSRVRADMAAIAVGGVVGLEAMFAGPISGASMNPARSLGPAVVSGHFESLWVYMAAPLVGVGLAVLAWALLRGGEGPKDGAAL